jgi:hypothetical protein
VNRKSKSPIPEPIAQLERQLDQFRSTRARRTKLPESLWQAEETARRNSQTQTEGGQAGRRRVDLSAGQDHGTRQAIQQLRAQPLDQRGSGISVDEEVPRTAGGVAMKAPRPRVDVNLEELDRVLDGARQAPLSEPDYDKVKGALHALAALLVRRRHTEKTSTVLETTGGSEPSAETQPDAAITRTDRGT